MKGKTKMQKGITLVALIITIIVLLILAVVSIRAVTGDGIIQYAKNARSEYEKGQTNESTILDSYLAQIDDATKVKWTQNKTTVTNGETTVEVGDYVDYKANVSGYTDTNGWRVLGAENGELLLISSSNVVTSLELTGAADYLNNKGIDKLNSKCEPYGKGEYATKVRSVKVEDINRVTGYNPEKTGNGNIYSKGEIDEYNNEVTYSLTSEGKVAYRSTNGIKGESDSQFMLLDYSNLSKDNPITIKNSYYTYYPNTLTDSASGDTIGVSKDSQAYKALFNNITYENGSYWLASTYERAGQNSIIYGMLKCDNSIISDGGMPLFDTSCSGVASSAGVRAVVSLKSDIKLKSNGANSWKLS